MSATPQFGTQLIGQTENALGAILDRTLSGSGLTRQHWITLTVAVMSGGTMSLDQLVNRVTGFCRSFCRSSDWATPTLSSWRWGRTLCRESRRSPRA
jgi:hypothetical protein